MKTQIPTSAFTEHDSSFRRSLSTPSRCWYEAPKPVKLALGMFACWSLWLSCLQAGQVDYTTAASFGPPDFAAASVNGLTQTHDGTLYGTTYGGGTGDGTIYTLDTNGLKLVYAFTKGGSAPYGPLCNLVQGSDGALYGTTGSGGSAGLGTVFKFDSSVVTVLHSFGSTFGDGETPMAGVIQGRDGALYGTTVSGGEGGQGTVFKLDTNGLSTLHSFTGANGDGAEPMAALVQGVDGALYGTTYSGGSSNLGTVFKVDTNGYNVVHEFTGKNGDGSGPFGGLALGADGTLYGTTFAGGDQGLGAIFKLANNVLSVIYSFKGGTGDGAHPIGGVVEGPGGVLFGTTVDGGASSLGVIYKLETTGLVILHDFTGAPSDGAHPTSDLLQASDGAFYGTATEGGAADQGSIFRLALGNVNQNHAPTIECPPAVKISGSPAEGSSVDLAVHVTDIDGDALKVTWNIDRRLLEVTAGGPPTDGMVTFTKIFPLGQYAIVITVSDGSNTAQCETSVTIEQTDSTPPELGPLPVAGPFVLGSGPQTVGPISATDNIALDLDKSVLIGTVDTSSVGTKTVIFTAVDTSGNSASKTGTYQVVYAPAGMLFGQPTRQVLAPVAPDGSSVFKRGRTVPLKFRVSDADGHSIGTPGVVTDFRLVKIITGTTVTEVNQVPVSTVPRSMFHWDASQQQWVFNLSTKNLGLNTRYVYRITLNDQTTIEFQFRVR